MENFENKKQIFVGRKKELKELESLFAIENPFLVVIKGRRRVGKSRLVAEFAKNKLFLSFKAKPPKQHETKQDRLDEFRERLQVQVGEIVPVFNDWFSALGFLKKILKPKTVLLFDEISWMAHGDDGLVGELKNFWDEIDHAGLHVMFFICGSVSTWIEKHITWGTALHGRVNLNFSLQPLSIPESAQILRNRGFVRSPREMIKILSFFGGVPWYLQQVKPNESANDTIKRLCFLPSGFLRQEFDIIFHDLFNGDRGYYKQIMYALLDGMKTIQEIKVAIKFSSQQKELEILVKNLCISGYVEEIYQWNLENTSFKSGETFFRIFDPYSRFYLKILESNQADINRGMFEKVAASNLPGLDGIVGLQVEQLLIQNRWLLVEMLQIDPAEVKYADPFRQLASSSKSGVQIDYLIHTIDKTVFVCEFKFSREKLGISIISEVQKKLDKIRAPVCGNLVPILFHASGVTDEVQKSGFFGKIIEVSELLNIDI